MSDRSKMVEVSTELLAELGEWSEPVRVKVVSDKDGVLDMVFRRSSAETEDRLREAGRAFLKKYDELKPAMDGAFQMQAIHGMPYSGPTWEQEINDLRQALLKGTSDE